MSDRILYIEDEEDYQLLVQRILGRAGLEVTIASTGTEGLAELRRQRPDLLILDINLPDTDGYTICRQLREDPAWTDLPILMLTVRRRPEEWLRGFASGTNDYVSKPLNPPELIERVVNALEGRLPAFAGEANPEYRQVQTVMNGNRGAYEVLVQKYRGRLMDNLMPVVKEQAEAEDVVSQAFVRAYERLDQFRGEASFYTWLYRIAMNVYFGRHKEVEKVSLESFASHDDTVPASLMQPPEPLPETVSEKSPAQQAHEVLGLVPEPFRQMLDLYFLKDLSYDDISRKLRIPVGTVMSRLFKARKLLQEAGRQV